MPYLPTQIICGRNVNKAIRSNKAISINEKEKLAIGEGNQTNER